MNKYISDSPNAPQAIGPYSQAVIAHNFAYLSGQIPIEPASGEIVQGGIQAQTEQVMKNLKAVLKHLGLDFRSVVSSRIYLTDLQHFSLVNGIYEQALGGVKPARATIQVSGLPKGALVEIEMVAAL